MRRTVVLVAVAALLWLSTAGAAVLAGPGGTTPAGAATGGGSSVTVSKTVTRSKVVSGQSVVVDSRSVTLHLSQTSGLQSRQEIAVSWTGAHPTGAVVADQNSAEAEYEEYPVVLLECRGSATASAPATAQISPETCWTQSSTERYQSSYGDLYPPYRLDEYAATPGAAVVGAPSTAPGCALDGDPPVQYWVPWDAADNDVYYGGPLGCAGEPPEANNVGGSAMPSNETFGVTDSAGTGTADFDVWTTAQNQTLGCSATVPCSLVAVPIMGISCDPAPAGVSPKPTATEVAQCETTGTYTAGAPYTSNQNPGTVADVSVTGALWWSPSNWRNRITVPLTFAPSPDLCSVTGSSDNNVVQVFGSELMIQATTQWEPHFCTSGTDRFSFVHVQTGEPEARNLLADGNIDAAFTSYAQTGGYPTPVANAPVALTGFAISYSVDGTDGQPYTTLRMTPLLLAKLLTESYPATSFVEQEDPALAHNPLNITLDPQFQALNPGIPKFEISGSLSEAASELIALSSDSDVMEALTTYINDDPAARAWLNGTPDQWGMVVNPAYKGIQLPVEQWPLLSTFEPTTYYDADGGQLNNCLYSEPQPFQPLVAAPLANLEDISAAIQFNEPNSTSTCVQPVAGSTVGEKLTSSGRQAPGYQFEIGVTPLADSQRYLLNAASLETVTGTYVAPSNTSLKVAGSLLTPDQTTGTWPIPYATFQTSAGAAAYPGTMLVYAAVPTSGLSATDAQDYATLLRFAVTTGQTPGPGVGQLPPGYLPLTAANGLGALAKYTLAAATDVAAQNGSVPALVASSAAPAATSPAPAAQAPPAETPSPATQQTTTVALPEAFHTFAQLPLSGVFAAAEPPAAVVAHHRATRAGPLRMLEFATTADDKLWVGGVPAPLVVGSALLGVLAVLAVYRVGRKRRRW